MPAIRPEVVGAVGWRIVAELFRRHHENAKLRLYETHPCSGMYDCLSLYHQSISGLHHLCDFNQASSHFHVFGHLNNPVKELSDLRWPDENDYVMAYLQSPDPKTVIDQIESVLGLPCARHPVPTTTPAVLCIRLIARILGRCAFERFGLDARSGLIDTSGFARSDVREELHLVPAVASQLPSRPEDRARFARRFWLFLDRARDGATEARAILDMRGIVYCVQSPQNEIHAWKEYQRDHQIDRIVLEIMAACNR